MKGTIKLFMVLGASIFCNLQAQFSGLGRRLPFHREIRSVGPDQSVQDQGYFEPGRQVRYPADLPVLSRAICADHSAVRHRVEVPHRPFRILSVKVDPIRDDIPPMVKCGNQILSNTIEQAVVFYGFYFYWLNAQKSTYKISIQQTSNSSWQ